MADANAVLTPEQQWQQQQMMATATADQTGQVPTGDASKLASLTMQSTGVNAGTSSIYAVQQPAGDQPSTVATGADGEIYTTPAYVPVPGFNPAMRSLYQGTAGQPVADPALKPLEDAANSTAVQPAIAATEQVPLDQQAAILADKPQELAALPADAAVAVTADESAGQVVAETPEQLAARQAMVDLAARQAAVEEVKPKRFTLAGFFGGKNKRQNTFNTGRFSEPQAKKTLTPQNVAPVQTASLAVTALPGVMVNSMFATANDVTSTDGNPEDDIAPPIEIAALPGLARLASNGFWMQTEKVESGCFRPELKAVLKQIEGHYGRKLMVTSGFRGEKSNVRKGGARHSLHTTCEAADIQIAGVSKWELASYLRTMPDRGGVGTYCHTESVHIDTGEPRDWNWRCRRRK